MREDYQRKERVTESIESIKKILYGRDSNSPRMDSASRAHFELSRIRESFRSSSHSQSNFMEKLNHTKQKIDSTIEDLRVIRTLEKNIKERKKVSAQ